MDESQALPVEGDSADEVERLLLPVLDLPEADWDAGLDRLCGEHPQFAVGLRQRMRILRELSDNGSPTTFPDRPGQVLGEFELLEFLGGGGMGNVYLARQGATGRRVALKLIRPEILHLPGARERFRREVEAASQVDDPGICTVFEAGEVEGIPFIAMRYVDGITLSTWIREQREKQPDPAGPPDSGASGNTRRRVEDLLRIFESLCRSVHKAHEQGLIHRDIKPGNVILDRDGQPVLLDFGLARTSDAAAVGLTMSADVLGTPAYMPPEQIAPKGRGIDRRADVYALGATLFECLTLERPFDGENREEIYRRVLRGEFTFDPEVSPGIPRDLRVVVEKAMETDRNRRYETAEELAEELRRVREFEPIRARPAGPVLRVRRWTQRNPTVAVFLMLVSIGLVVSLVLLAEVRREERVSRSRSLIGASARELDNDPATAVRLALTARLLNPAPDARIYSQLASALAAHRQVGVRGPLKGMVRWLRHSADGKHQAAGHEIAALVFGPDGEPTALIEPPTGLMTGPAERDPSTDGRRPEAQQGDRRREEFRGMAFVPGTGQLVLCGADGFLHFYGIDGTRAHSILVSRTHPVLDVEFFDSGTRFVAVSGDGCARFFATGSRDLRKVIPTGAPILDCAIDQRRQLLFLYQMDGLRAYRLTDYSSHEPALVAFQTDHRHRIDLHATKPWLTVSPLVTPGRRLGPKYARLRRPTGVLLLDYETGKTEWLGDRPAMGSQFCGDRIAAVYSDYHMRIFRPDGRVVSQPRHDAAVVESLAVSPDGSLIATGCNDNAIRLFTPDGAPFKTLYGHRGWVKGLWWSPDGEQLFSSANDVTLRTWAIRGGLVGEVPAHRSAVRSLRPTPAGGVLSASWDGSIRSWSAELQPLGGFESELGLADAVQLPSGPAVMVGKGSVVQIVDLQRNAVVGGPFDLGGQSATSVNVLGDSDFVVTCFYDAAEPTGVWRFARRGDRWHQTRFRVPQLQNAEGTQLFQRLSGNQRAGILMAPCYDKCVRIVDWAGSLLHTLSGGHRARLHDVASDHGGDILVSVGSGGLASIWDLKSGNRRTVDIQAGGLNAVAVSPDGQRFAVCSADGEAQIWTIEGEHLVTYRHNWGSVRALMFSVDGTRLFTAGTDTLLHSWPTDRELLVTHALRRVGPFRDVELSRYASDLGGAEKLFESARKSTVAKD